METANKARRESIEWFGATPADCELLTDAPMDFGDIPLDVRTGRQPVAFEFFAHARLGALASRRGRWNDKASYE